MLSVPEKEFIEKFDEVAREGLLKAKGNIKLNKKSLLNVEALNDNRGGKICHSIPGEGNHCCPFNKT